VDEELQRQSEGADLAQLLLENDPLYAQAHYRYRGHFEAPEEPPPFAALAEVEQVGPAPSVCCCDCFGNSSSSCSCMIMPQAAHSRHLAQACCNHSFANHMPVQPRPSRSTLTKHLFACRSAR
jgi:hypothetical protein